jgi:hypothetical protein
MPSHHQQVEGACFISHYWNHVLCWVSKTLGKGHFILGKVFAECNPRQTFYRQRVFAEYFFWTLVKDFVECRKALGKLRIKKIQKTTKQFLNYRNNSPTTTYYHTHRPIILNQIYMFCEWWDSNSQPLSPAYPHIPLHYYINYIYIMFSFLMYYNKPRLILLFKALNELIWKCDQL